MSRQPWKADATEALVNLWMEGHSARQIGAVLGVTRNAVIGRVHRLKLDRGKGWHAPIPPPHLITPKPAPKLEPAPREKGKTLLAVGSHECRFPVSEEGARVFLVCAEPSGAAAYCPEHQKLCYSVTPRLRQGILA